MMSISAADGWLKPACMSLHVCDVRVCSRFFCVGVRPFVGQGRGKRKNRKRVRGDRNAVCVGGTQGSGVKKNIMQTKQQEIKFSSQGYIQVENECPCVICQCQASSFKMSPKEILL